MATWIPNQPVFFGTTDVCNSDEITINQIVDNTDVTQFQFELDPCVSAQQIMPDPNFTDADNYVLADNWSIVDGVLCLSGDSVLGSTITTGTGGSTILSIFTLGEYYVVTIVVDSISVGGSVDVWIGADVIGTITSTGTYTFYGFAINQFAVNGYPLALVSTTEGTNICISSITSFEILTNLIFPIYTEDGTYVTNISYSADPDYFTFSEDSVTVTVDWAELGLSNNCYYICLLDPCENTGGQNYPPVITNGTFTGGSTGWTFGSHWVYSSNAMVGTYSVSESQGLTQANVFNSFTNTFCISVTISSGVGSVDVYFGSNLVDTISGVATHEVSGICDGTFDLVFVITSGTATIDTVRACDILPVDYVCNSQSNSFSLKDYSGECTKLINACNNENGLGFNFNNSGFTPRIRLEAKLKQAKYANERTIFEDSVGKKNVVYFNGRKTKDLAIDLQPEYVHDFLRLLLGFDNLYIDGELYFVEDDEYSLEYSDVSDELAKVKIQVSKRTQNVKNINCSDTQNVCTLPPDYLLRADDLAFRVVQTDGYGILING